MKEKDNKINLKKLFGWLDILKIDMDKPVPFRQQFAVMCTVLIISCLLFTVVYFQQMITSGVSEKEVMQTSVSEKNEAAEGVEKKKKEDKSEKTETSKKNEVKKQHVSVQDNGESASELIGSMTTVSKEIDELHKGKLILVNKDYSCRYDGENVKEMKDLKSSSYILIDYSVCLDPSIADSLNSMMDDFAEMYGDNDLMIACGYRSYETQIKLFNTEIENKGESDAEQWVAPPGYSEHQTGYVLDLDLNKDERGSGINFDGNGLYSWLNDNCDEYGFVVRYIEGKEKITGYNYEPWHFRYVGIPHSQYMTDNKIALEEYLELLQQHTEARPLVVQDHKGVRWCIYYTPVENWDTTQINVPAEKEYTISGDNYSGYIVTVKLDAIENYSEESSSDEVYSEEGTTDEGYSGEDYSDEGYSGEGYSDEGYSGEGYSDEDYSGEGYSDEGYSEEW